MSVDNKKILIPKILAWIVLIVFILVSVLAFVMVKNSLEKVGLQNLQNRTLLVKELMDNDFLTLAIRQPLATRALFDASDFVSAEEFHDFFESREVIKNFPSISFTAFSRYVKNDQKQELVKEIESTNHVTRFEIFPETKNDYIAPAIYVEPHEGTEELFGFDALSEPNRAKVINEAIDSGQFILSDRIKVYPSEKTGFVGYLPVYNKDITASSTVSERRANIYGFISTIFEAERLFGNFNKNILALNLGDLDIEIFDGDKPAADSILYDFDSSKENKDIVTGNLNFEKDASLVVNTTLILGGHVFTLSVASEGGLVLSQSRMMPYFVLGGGTLIGLFLFVIIYLLAIQYGRAYVLAEKMTLSLKESEIKYRSLFDDSRDAIMTIEPPTWKFTLGNQSAFKMFGARDEEDFVSRTPYDYSPEKQPDGQLSSVKARQMIDIAVKTGSNFFNWTHKRLDGTEFSATVLLSRVGEGDRVYIQAIVRDISMQEKESENIKQKNKELEQSQRAVLSILEDISIEKKKSELLIGELQKFKLAVDNASDHIIITDPDGVILYANKAVERITGYSSKEVIGAKPSLWGRQMPKEIYEKLWKTIKVDKEVFVGELNNKRKNGEIYVAEANISPVLNSDGNVVFFVGIERDITLLKEISDAKTEFVSVASHQLRTPLTGIKWLTELLLKNKENNLTEKQKETLKDISLSNDRIIALVNDLLSISRIESGKSRDLVLGKVEISKLVNEVVSGLRPVAENRKVDFREFIVLPVDIKLKIDEEKIRQSMNNLISNAIKYSKLNDGKVDVLAEIKGGEFIFSVKDNGIGIPMKDQRRLFEKFFRADNAVLTQTEGTGLGLFIVKSYIESHGGRIWFESEENKGSTFSFSLKAS